MHTFLEFLSSFLGVGSKTEPLPNRVGLTNNILNFQEASSKIGEMRLKKVLYMDVYTEGLKCIRFWSF